jgi:membrane protein
LIYKFADDQGPFLAALITYYGFLSLFPLLLLATSILGLILDGNPGLRHRILDSTLSQFPVIGQQLGEPKGLQGNPAAIIVGGVIAVYGAIGVAQAFQNASNIAWSIPRNRRPNPLKARLRSLGLLTMGGIAILVTTVLSALAGSATQYGANLGPVVPVLFFLLAIAINACAFLLAFNMCTVATSSLRTLAPGALTAAVVWQLLQVFGTAYVGHVVKGAGPTYGAFALVLGLLAWLYLANLGVVFGIEINVVLAKNLYPRALLTPFTDDVDLTPGDVVAYTHAAQAQQTKGFENVTVTFQDEGQHATARRRRRLAWPWHRQHGSEPPGARPGDEILPTGEPTTGAHDQGAVAESAGGSPTTPS